MDIEDIQFSVLQFCSFEDLAIARLVCKNMNKISDSMLIDHIVHEAMKAEGVGAKGSFLFCFSGEDARYYDLFYVYRYRDIIRFEEKFESIIYNDDKLDMGYENESYAFGGDRTSYPLFNRIRRTTVVDEEYETALEAISCYRGEMHYDLLIRDMHRMGYSVTDYRLAYGLSWRFEERVLKRIDEILSELPAPVFNAFMALQTSN